MKNCLTVLKVLLASAVAFVSFSAHADLYTLNFSGTCTDCSGNGDATLVVSGPAGSGTTSPLLVTTDNFVSFNYAGTPNLEGFNHFDPFQINAGDFGLAVTGSFTFSLDGSPFGADFLVTTLASETAKGYGFRSTGTGDWFTGPTQIDTANGNAVVISFRDTGTEGRYTVAGTNNVPEPATWMIAALGLLMLVAVRRQRSAR